MGFKTERSFVYIVLIWLRNIERLDKNASFGSLGDSLMLYSPLPEG